MLRQLRERMSSFVRHPAGRLIFFGVGIAVAYLLFPGLRRSSVNLTFAVKPDTCVEQLQVSLLREGNLEHQIRGRLLGSELDWQRKLRPTIYEVKPTLHCADGSRKALPSRPLDVSKDEAIKVFLRGPCSCSS